MELEKIIRNLTELKFTALDFETANEKRDSICSIGLVSILEGKISNKINILVKPKEFRFSEINKRIHGISENDVINAPEFNEVWEQLSPFIENQIILAHNADFDIDALKQTLNSYNLRIPYFKFICTQKLAQEAFPELQNYRLTDVAVHLGLNLTHHNSISDAILAAEIGIKAIPIYNKSFYSFGHEDLTHYIEKKDSLVKKNNYLSGFTKKAIDKTLLSPNLEGADKDNLFYNKKVVFTGDMQGISRQDAAIKIKNLGADINTSISKKTDLVIIGVGAGPSKMSKIEELNSQGCNIRLIYENEFLALLNS